MNNNTLSHSTSSTILIVDDHPSVRDGLTVHISRQTNLRVCGEAAGLDEALAKTKELHPDLVIVDISLKQGHGIDLIKQIRTLNLGTVMLVHSMYDDTIYAERALQAGAMGYVNKQEAPETMIEAIRHVLSGDVYLSSKMTRRILSRRVSGKPEVGSSPIENLSDRELEVFELIGEGLTSGTIANRLHLSVHTIDTHREKIKRKLGVRNSTELSRQAVQWVLENG